MDKSHDIRDTVIRSLSAIGAVKDARFYAELFSKQAPESFALIVIDPRCLKNPLLEALSGNLRILSDLGLTPTLLVGALDEDMTRIGFLSQRLAKELESLKVKVGRLNTESYGLFDSLRKAAKSGKITILENTTDQKRNDLQKVVEKLKPGKVIFLQPSGGITRNGRRISVINIDDPDQVSIDDLSAGQSRFIEMAQALLKPGKTDTVYVIASPLNLLQELFTIKGSGTLIRTGANIKAYKSLRGINKTKLKSSIESGFDKPVITKIAKWPVKHALMDTEYRGGAILSELAGLTYLSKFWVVKEAQGEGIARDIWEKVIRDHPKFFWRSKMNNPFNDWYMKSCDGMQVSGDWRVFWRGLVSADIAKAIEAAKTAPIDL